MAAWHAPDLESGGQADTSSAQRKIKMKFLGKFKPYVLPLALGILGALIYDRWVKNRLPAMLRGGAALLMLTLSLAFTVPDLRADDALNLETAMHFAVSDAPSSDAVSAGADLPLAVISSVGTAVVCALGLGFLVLAVTSSRGRKSCGIAAMFAALAFGCVPAFAEVVNKGGAIYLRPLNRETANFAYTNGVANPGLPMLLRVTSHQGTNHWGIGTNGVPVVANLGTNYQGFTGTILLLGTNLFFKHGMLVTTNAQANP